MVKSIKKNSTHATVPKFQTAKEYLEATLGSDDEPLSEIEIAIRKNLQNCHNELNNWQNETDEEYKFIQAIRKQGTKSNPICIPSKLSCKIRKKRSRAAFKKAMDELKEIMTYQDVIPDSEDYDNESTDYNQDESDQTDYDSDEWGTQEEPITPFYPDSKQRKLAELENKENLDKILKK